MATSTTRRTRTALVCTECGQRNYRRERPIAGEEKRVTVKKFCPPCNRHTVHQETR